MRCGVKNLLNVAGTLMGRGGRNGPPRGNGNGGTIGAIGGRIGGGKIGGLGIICDEEMCDRLNMCSTYGIGPIGGRIGGKSGGLKIEMGSISG